MGGDRIMAFNLGEKLKNQGVANPSKLFSQGESADKLRDELIKEENLEPQEDTEKNKISKLNESKYFSSFLIKIDEKLNNKIATLEVESNDKKNIIIRCRHSLYRIDEQLDTEPIEAPQISFEKAINSQTFNDIFGQMNLFSKKNGQAKKIRGWLLRLREKLENNSRNKEDDLFYLVINDRSNFEIPWEMLYLKDHDYLGSSILTVRWQDITDPDNLEDVYGSISLEIEKKECCGNMIAYLNTKDLKHVENEKINIEQFNPIIYKNIDDLFEYLDYNNSQISLVFIASHGFMGDNLSAVKLGEENTKQQISITKLYEYEFNFFKNSSCIIFMNTCHSGRLLQDENQSIIDSNPVTKQPYSIGFSTFFLENGAVGVIGTLCKVIDKYAAIISSNFFTEYKKNPNLSVATILKNLRAKAVEKYQQERNQENKYLLISTFMYVYYGNPLAKLNIRESN